MRTLHCSPVLALLPSNPGAADIKKILDSLLFLRRLSQEGGVGEAEAVTGDLLKQTFVD